MTDERTEGRMGLSDTETQELAFFFFAPLGSEGKKVKIGFERFRTQSKLL